MLATSSDWPLACGVAAMDALASARAAAVHDFIAAQGFDAQRLSMGLNREEQASMGFVPLEFTLTVFGEEPEAEADATTEAPAEVR